MLTVTIVGIPFELTIQEQQTDKSYAEKYVIEAECSK
jgi:hypothetical protein